MKQSFRMVGALALAAVSGAAQSVSKETYDFNFIGQPLPDPVLQHAKETFVLFGCAYCHGLNLVTRGEATDLMHSRLVGQDVDGDLIGPLLRAGIPQTAKLSPMPQFSDLSDQQIGALVLWIHYARSEGRFRELTEARDPPTGDAGKGKAYFDQRCASCHSVLGDLAGVAKKYSSAALKTAFLKPKTLDGLRSWKVDEIHDVKTAAAKAQHRTLLENYSAEEASNLTAFLATLN
jgi:mono/diheme cytochrome c family protein